MIEFITKAPSSAKTTLQKFRTPTIKLNTTNNNVNFSKDIIAKLKGDNEEFRFGFGYDRDQKIVVLYTTEEGLKPSVSGTITAKHHKEDIIKTLDLQEHEGSVIVFSIDLEKPVIHKDENVGELNLYPLTFSETTEPRRRAKQGDSQEPVAETPSAPVEEKESPKVEEVDVAAIKAAEEAEARKAVLEAADAENEAAMPQETTEAEQTGAQPNDIKDLGEMPPAPGQPQENASPSQSFKWPGQG